MMELLPNNQRYLNATAEETQAALAAICRHADERAAQRKDAERYCKLRDADMDVRNRLEHYSGPALDVVLDALPAVPT